MLRFVFSFIFCASIFFLYNDVQSREMTEYPRVKLQSLDKATARTMTFEAEVGNTLKFGPLYIKPQSCQKSSPIDEPESAAFLQIWEVDTEGESEWVFSGWMFSSSPGLSSMNHAIYDVWVLECLKNAGDETSEDAHPPEDLESNSKTDGANTENVDLLEDN